MAKQAMRPVEVHRVTSVRGSLDEDPQIVPTLLSGWSTGIRSSRVGRESSRVECWLVAGAQAWWAGHPRVTVLHCYSVSPLPEDRWSSGNGHVFRQYSLTAYCWCGPWYRPQPPIRALPGSAAQRVGKRGFRLSATKPGFPPLRVRFGVRPVFGRSRRSVFSTAEFAIPPTHPAELPRGT